MDASVAQKDLYDENAYLAKYADVKAAVQAGKEKSGWTHYLRKGQLEGREISGFDPAFYLRSYPLAGEEIAAGLVRGPLEHYLKYGKGRGYLATIRSDRPDNAAAMPGRFGGFWLDQPNALDLIQGKVETKQITEEQAVQLRFWVDEGYIILKNAIPKDVVEGALADLEKGYSGKIPQLKFECEPVIKSRIASPWQPAMNEFPTKALDIHVHSEAIRKLVFADELAKFLGVLFDSPAFATQTLGFLLGSGQDGHQDSAYVAYSVPKQFCASWIALEDVTLGAGELFYYPGSHKFPDFLYSSKYKSLHEAMRMGNGEFPKGEVSRHVASLRARAVEANMEKKALEAKKGDVLFWHADLVHGGNPVSKTVTRKSVVTHYCPKYISPVFAENRKTKVHHYGHHVYTSSYYLA